MSHNNYKGVEIRLRARTPRRLGRRATSEGAGMRLTPEREREIRTQDAFDMGDKHWTTGEPKPLAYEQCRKDRHALLEEIDALRESLNDSGYYNPCYCPNHATKEIAAEEAASPTCIRCLRALTTWQPMESAPKDGTTRIDLWAKAWLPAFDRFEYRRFTDCLWMKGDSTRNVSPYWLNLDKQWCPVLWTVPALPAPPTTTEGK